MNCARGKNIMTFGKNAKINHLYICKEGDAL